MKRFGAIRYLSLCLIFAAVCFVPVGSAQAYIGPGLGVGTLALVLGVIGSVLLAIFAIVWYPIKRMLKRMLKKRRAAAQAKDRQTKE